ncbi:DUF4132 domain-containing protein [Actinomadura rifamycini]|uniref:DUF4132 domain-containing protein n=1 Tax=Actinomadura rifamycini TaxID=31962 RepID=UPI000424F51A|nr:DUF4132 domain-containing protein [Actinomadura rifamycini]
MDEQPSSPSDENALNFPDAWRRSLYPRRGGRPGSRIKIDRSASANLRERFARLEASAPLAERAGVGAEPAEAAHEYVSGGANPLGAAVVAALLTHATGGTSHLAGGTIAKPLADAWVSEHGPAFAACAFAELSGLHWGDHGIASIDDRMEVGSRTVGSTGLPQTGARLRGLLAVASDEEYREAVERLAEHRRAPTKRVAVSFLVPDRHDWVEDCFPATRHYDSGWGFWRMLFASLGSSRHVDMAVRAIQANSSLVWSWDRSVVITMVDGAGDAITPLFLEALDLEPGNDTVRKSVPEMLAVLPGEAAFQGLVERADLVDHTGRKIVLPALLDAVRRFPVRALRLLAPAASGSPQLGRLLAEHVEANRDLAAEALPGLAPEVRAVIDGLLDGDDRLPDAPADALPPLLVDPPWARTTKPDVVPRLAPPGPAMRWAPGERDRWAQPKSDHKPEGWSWDELADDAIAKGYILYSPLQAVVTHCSEDKVRSLPAMREPKGRAAISCVRQLAARFGLEALPTAMAATKFDPVEYADVLMPFLDVGAARLTAGYLPRPSEERREAALAWFDRHGLDAVPLLVPDAVGRPGARRGDAEEALRLLARKYPVEEIADAAARAHGDEAARAVEALVTVDGLERLPARMPSVGTWASPHSLPQIRLRGRRDALPADAAGHVLTMLAMSAPGAVYAGVDVVRELCDPGSLAEFGWALFQLWEQSGAPAKDNWALAQLAWLGDDETVRRLTPVIRAWPGRNGHHKAVAGLEILAGIGTDVALMHLHGIAQKVKFEALRDHARDKIRKVADGLGLTSEQLADRLVPDFGLDASGGLVLDYGRRRFHVGFDENLRPLVRDENGAARKALPKPGAKDDPEMAPAAYKRFAALKKDVQMVAADQIHRLERSMLTRRRWPVGDFRRLLVEHPLIGHIVRRLVWVAEDGGKAAAFRVAEDGTFADAADDVLTVPDSAAIGIPHPVDLDGSLEAWSALFSEYEILQPFPQLERTVHTLTDAERAARRLERFQGRTFATRTLDRLGWHRTAPMDAGLQHAFYRAVPGGRSLNISLNPPIAIDEFDAFTKEIWLDDHTPNDSRAIPYVEHPFGDLDPATASEVLAELTAAMS